MGNTWGCTGDNGETRMWTARSCTEDNGETRKWIAKGCCVLEVVADASPILVGDDERLHRGDDVSDSHPWQSQYYQGVPVSSVSVCCLCVLFTALVRWKFRFFEESS